jgi:hypothetical protein
LSYYATLDRFLVFRKRNPFEQDEFHIRHVNANHKELVDQKDIPVLWAANILTRSLIADM